MVLFAAVERRSICMACGRFAVGLDLVWRQWVGRGPCVSPSESPAPCVGTTLRTLGSFPMDREGCSARPDGILPPHTLRLR